MIAVPWKITYCSILCLVLMNANKIAKADNVLFLSWPLYSHVQSMCYVAKELDIYSHTSYFPMTDKLAKTFRSYEGVKVMPMKHNPHIIRFKELAVEQFQKNTTVTWSMMAQSLKDVCDSFLLDENWFQSLKAINATIAVVDYVFMSNCLAIIPYRLSIPYVFQGINPEHFATSRTPWVASAFPHMIMPYSDKMNFYERIINNVMTMTSYFRPLMGKPSKSIKTYAPEKADISFDKLMNQADLYLLEMDLLTEYPLPSLPNVVYVGGVATRPPSPLEGEISKFVEKSNRGIIVVSFGSIISKLPKEHIKKMELAFGQINYDVIWKRSPTKSLPSNIYVTQWLPQNDLLGHPKTLLFITHCGSNGQFEAVYHGVPMLGFPVFADQFHNAHRIQIKGYGISMDMNSYSKDELVSTINELIENPKYKNNIKRASDIYRSRPEHPAAKGARNIDHVIKYGGDYLRSHCQTMPLYQFLMLDIYGVFLVVILIFLHLMVYFIRKCYRCCCVKKTKTD